LILYIFSHVGPSLSMFDFEKCVLIIFFHHEGTIFWGGCKVKKRPDKSVRRSISVQKNFISLVSGPGGGVEI
jgi:hypothetical protein